MRYLIAALAALVLIINPVMSKDVGQWTNVDPEVSAWFKTLRQPDNPASCCGEADAYWADSYETEGDHYVAIITDDRPDEPLKRKHVPIGTRIPVPNFKMKFDKGNPTGHGIIFLNQSVTAWLSDGKQHNINVAKNAIDDYIFVFCYIQPGGV